MYGIVDRSGEYVKSYYRKGYPLDEVADLGIDEVQNYIFDRDGVFESGSTIDNRELYDDIVENIVNGESESYHTYRRDNVYYYYKITKLDHDSLLVTLVGDNSRLDYRNGLLNSVVNMIVVVVGAFFIVVMIWMGYLIHPLNQIRNYIEKIKQGEDAKLKINREDEIGELAYALIKMRDELKRQEKVKEEMIHNISHDLKTPIATIKSYGESIKDGIYPYGTLEGSVDVIITNANRLEKKVHSLLYLNRIDYIISNTDTKEVTNMRKLVNSVVAEARVRNQNICIVASTEETFFKGNEEPWRVAIENIIENGMRYAKTKITINLTKDELTIENDGPSISDDRLKSMFKPFEKGTDGQFGLGLSIVSRVVGANGFKVEAGNTIDGVIFRIYR